MKHICFVTRTFNRQDSLIVYRQGKSLVEAGYKVTYIIADNLPPEIKFGINIVPVDIHYTKSSNKLWDHLQKDFKANKNLFKEALKCDADVFQINEPELLPLGSRLKRKGYNVVFNLREYYPDFYARKFRNPILKKCAFIFLERYFKYIGRKYDAIFNCMPEMADYVESVMPCKYIVNVANFPIVNEDFSLSFEDYCKRDNVISYFGTIYDISCQEEFLEALLSVPNVKYLLAGKALPHYLAKLKKYPAWNRQVIFKDGFKHEELPNIINSSIMGNVMKDFAQTETPGGSYSIIKTFESMEAAIPIILAKVPLYEKMVEKYHCGICVNPHNVKEIANAIQYLLNNKKEAYEMGQNGRTAVLAEFSWDTQWQNYIKVIQAIIK